MAHHKRRRPKHQRMKCACKGYKDEREAKRPRPSDARRLAAASLTEP